MKEGDAAPEIALEDDAFVLVTGRDRGVRLRVVGDHLQLPPVVDPEITLKVRENEPENQELGEWLEKKSI